MFRAHVLIIRRSKLHYTASGIIKPIGGRLVHAWDCYKYAEMHGQQNVKTAVKCFRYWRCWTKQFLRHISLCKWWFTHTCYSVDAACEDEHLVGKMVTVMSGHNAGRKKGKYQLSLHLNSLYFKLKWFICRFDKPKSSCYKCWKIYVATRGAPEFVRINPFLGRRYRIRPSAQHCKTKKLREEAESRLISFRHYQVLKTLRWSLNTGTAVLLPQQTVLFPVSLLQPGRGDQSQCAFCQLNSPTRFSLLKKI